MTEFCQYCNIILLMVVADYSNIRNLAREALVSVSSHSETKSKLIKSHADILVQSWFDKVFTGTLSEVDKVAVDELRAELVNLHQWHNALQEMPNTDLSNDELSSMGNDFEKVIGSDKVTQKAEAEEEACNYAEVLFDAVFVALKKELDPSSALFLTIDFLIRDYIVPIKKSLAVGVLNPRFIKKRALVLNELQELAKPRDLDFAEMKQDYCLGKLNKRPEYLDFFCAWSDFYGRYPEFSEFDDRSDSTYIWQKLQENWHDKEGLTQDIVESVVLT